MRKKRTKAGRKSKHAPSDRHGASGAEPVTARSSSADLAVALEYHRSGELEEAASRYRDVLQRDPDQPDALHLLGVIAYQQGKQEEAADLIGKAISQNPSVADFHLNLGNVHLARGSAERAVVCYNEALRLNPGDPTVHNNLGNALSSQGDFQSALQCYKKALVLNPNSAITNNNLGTAWKELGRYDAAIACYRRALELAPGLVEALVNLGSAYHLKGDLESAVTSCQKALEIKPESTEARFNLGNILQEQGDFDGARVQYESVLRLDPYHAKTHYNLSLSRKYTSSDSSHGERIASMLNKPDLSEKDRIYLQFALGKISSDCGSYDDAFKHYREANQMARPAFNREGHARYITRVVETYAPEFFKLKGFGGSDSERPVFVVGMPRAGTTLVEQVISSHPRIEGAGELSDLDMIGANLPKTLSVSRPYPDCIAWLDERTARALAESYLERLRLVSESALRVVDKMPTNYLHLGLIAVLFPRARIIHCQRDPMDVCLSCYFQYFSTQLNFTFDLVDLGFYYRQYERLMAHWRRVLPVPLLEIRYEDLVQNHEEISRRLVDFCGLEWDERCLEFYNNRRPVKTASSWQVRQPIYATSVARWKPYERYLESLREALER